MAVTGTEELDTIDEFQEGVLKNVQLAGLITPLNWNVEKYEEINSAHQFPEDLTILSIRELGQQHSFWVGQLGRALFDLSKAEGDLLLAERAYEQYYSMAFLKTETVDENGKKKLAGAIESEAILQKDVQKWANRKMVSQATFTMMKNLVKTYERYADALSREMTRRDMEKPDLHGWGEG